MTENTARPRMTPGRVGGRAMLALVALITVLATLSFLLNDIVRIAYLFEGGYGIEVTLSSFGGLPAEIAGANGQNTADYWKAIINTYENVDTSRTLQALAIGLTSLMFTACAVTILLLCRRLWTGRTFATSASVGVLVVSALTIVTAWVAPLLRHTADTLALAATPFQTEPVEGTDHAWATLPHHDIGTVDETMLVLGVILGLTALVYLGARRLQLDSEGLV